MSQAYHTSIEVRPIESHEVKIVARLSNEEGWNIDTNYLQICHSLDGMKWYGAAVDEQIIGSCTSYEFEDGRTAMIGLFIVDKPHRNSSIGSGLMHTVCSSLSHCNVLCSAVQPSRMRNISPFCPSLQMWVWSCRKQKGCLLPNSKYIQQLLRSSETKLLTLRDITLENVAQYDASFSATNSVLTSFFKNIIIGHGSNVLVAVNSSSEVVGYAVLRKANQGWRFAPIYGDSTEVGYKLFTALLDIVPEGDLITINTFDGNSFMNSLLNDFGFDRNVSATLMYTKHPIDVPVERVFGIMNLEFTPF